MFEQFIATLNQPNTQNAFGYAQQMMECTLKLTKSQAEVMQGLCDEVMQEYREALSSGDPSTLQKTGPRFMSTVLRANIEAAALMVKNAKEFQSEMYQMMQISEAGFPGQIMTDMMEVVRTNGSTRPAAKAKKAA